MSNLIDIKGLKKGNFSLVNGINFGCQYQGYYDYPLQLFSAVSIEFFSESANAKDKAEFLQTVANIKMDEQIMNFLMNISSKSDLSPLGFLCLLQFVHDAILNEHKEFMQKIFKNCMKLLCSMIRDNQLLSIQEWPVKCFGGIEIVQSVIL